MGQACAFKLRSILKIRNLQFYNHDVGIKLESYLIIALAYLKSPMMQLFLLSFGYEMQKSLIIVVCEKKGGKKQ